MNIVGRIWRFADTMDWRGRWPKPFWRWVMYLCWKWDGCR